MASSLVTIDEKRRAFKQAILNLSAFKIGRGKTVPLLHIYYFQTQYNEHVFPDSFPIPRMRAIKDDGTITSRYLPEHVYSKEECQEILANPLTKTYQYAFTQFPKKFRDLKDEAFLNVHLCRERHEPNLDNLPEVDGVFLNVDAILPKNLDPEPPSPKFIIPEIAPIAHATPEEKNDAKNRVAQPSTSASSWKAKWASKLEAARAQAQKLSQKIDTLENKSATTQKMGKALRFTFNAAVSAGITLGAKALTCTVAAASCSAMPTIAAVAAIAATGAIVGVLGAAAKDFAKERFVEKNKEAKFCPRDRFMAKKTLLRAASGMTGALVGVDALNGFETLKSAFDTVKGWMPSFGLKAPASVIQTAARAASATAKAASAVASTVAQSAPAKALADAAANTASSAELKQLKERATSAKESAARTTRRAAWAAQENATSAKLGEKWTALREAWRANKPEGQEWIRTTVTPNNPPPVQTPFPAELTETKALSKPVAAAPLTPDTNPVAQAVTKIESCEEIGNGITQCDTLTLKNGDTITAQAGTGGTPGESVTLPGGGTLTAQHLPSALSDGTQPLAYAGSTPAP